MTDFCFTKIARTCKDLTPKLAIVAFEGTFTTKKYSHLWFDFLKGCDPSMGRAADLCLANHLCSVCYSKRIKPGKYYCYYLSASLVNSLFMTLPTQ
jgi:hypothetical protein